MKHFVSFGSFAFIVAISSLGLTYRDAVTTMSEGQEEAVSSASTTSVAPLARRPKNDLLTILVDDIGDCPDNCEHFHMLLPKWVRFQYKTFKEKDIRSVMDPEKEGLTFRSLTGVTGHILLVSRMHIPSLAIQAEYHRKAFNASVGLFLIGDEFHKLQDRFQKFPGRCNSFDYILRNYWFSQEIFDPVPLRALGNMTCGAPDPKPPLPAIPQGPSHDTTRANNPHAGPRWGLHWTFLLPHAANALLRRSHKSTWPTKLRPTNCSFNGWGGGGGSKDRTMVESLSQKPEYKALNCSVKLYEKFNNGNDKFHNKFHYVTHDIGHSKIVFNPRGNHPECHRLPETLISGSVPAMKQEKYMDFVYKPIPGIIEPTWKEVFAQVKYHLESETVPTDSLNSSDETYTRKTLGVLSQEAAKWWADLQDCMKADLTIILAGAFGDYENPSYATT
jgi:hypothetical protein